jgi:hypothetical protein
MRNRAVLLSLLLAFGCGKREKPAAAPQGGGTPAPVQPKATEPAPPPAPTPPAPDPEERKRKREELKAKVGELERALKDLEAKHEGEMKGLPEVGLLRRTYTQAILDARRKEAELEALRERQNELKKLAESSVRGKLKELRDERGKIAARQDAIQDAWRQSLEDAKLGTVEESPVKKDLDTIRDIKRQWFAATPLARRGAAKENERKIINDGFRGWLGEMPDRKRVVGQILGLPQAPKGKTPDSYDFTDLRFFLLLELMETQIEKQNIAVEKKELTENRGKLEAIQKELDAIDAKIHEHLVEGGEELQEYEELIDRLPLVQQSASYLSERVGVLKSTLDQIDELRQRHTSEEDGALKAVEEARKELAALR